MADYPDDADGDALARLESYGVDMNQPLVIEFAIAAPDEAVAERIATALHEQGYSSQVEFDEGEPDYEPETDSELEDHEEEYGPAWTVYVAVEMIPRYAEVTRVQADLDRIAQSLGGYCDGWGVILDSDESSES